ncbi:Capsular glucan synthase [Candidatus Xiphinematobacter sp. Idaho Grape]|uniref:glycogen synthase n=1 Tax=Candidatus Xiphinematobacter sp. Idaho Grape TaxID=1704307 RepID=UPI00070690AA|nr:glycogen synthase [Candidatus Xiphinematobacter sp. Idaho Grape]ALJ56630.1 Capsular glucan synthase [Candidatus Xiphinematobacter sp. Idaho Grape]
MRVLFLTNEYPPNVYGGAGTHVDYLSRYLSKLVQVEVRCFGDQMRHAERLRVRGFSFNASELCCPRSLRSVFGALQRCLDFNTIGVDADIVHCHTWYAYFGGIVAKLNYGIPLVITVHSLELLRPWKGEQLGRGYDFTCWLEATTLRMADAVIAVSLETKRDILRLFGLPEHHVHVVYNGVDLDEYTPMQGVGTLRSYGIDPSQPYVLFIGRITRQKGMIHLVRAIRHFVAGLQVVICAGAPDTPEVEMEIRSAIARVQQLRQWRILWIQKMLDVRSKVELYSHASIFICPSIYEPFGIINLEAMACGTAVVASAIGGIKEVVVDGITGFLVPFRQSPDIPGPIDADQFELDLAVRVNTLMADAVLRQKMGTAGRLRAEGTFGWNVIARQTQELYKRLAEL